MRESNLAPKRPEADLHVVFIRSMTVMHMDGCEVKYRLCNTWANKVVPSVPSIDEAKFVCAERFESITI